MFGLPSGSEWLIFLLLLLIVFGAGKLPKAGCDLGRAIADMREREPIPRNAEPEIGFDLMVAITLTVAAVACAIVLAMAQAGWV